MNSALYPEEMDLNWHWSIICCCFKFAIWFRTYLVCCKGEKYVQVGNEKGNVKVSVRN